MIIKVSEFSKRLDARELSVEDFRKYFLSDLENESFWKNRFKSVTFDFKDVEFIGPSFANKLFNYYKKYASEKEILKKFKFKNITNVKKTIITEELKH